MGGGVILKGSGFYTTDYRSKSYHSEAQMDGGGSKSNGSCSIEKKKAAG